ncbi:MAG: precorrin-2 C(20)-methyltransferase [Prevotella sp.]|nr:precorrin-2 C(20)-methyltransferase [Prevotella sp.]
MSGKTNKQPEVSFLSLGPGDAELLTAKAIRLLRKADVVMVPSTDKKSRAADIVGEWCDESRLEPFLVPMSKDRRAVKAVYDEMAERIKALRYQGLQVVVAVEGDVSIYASIHYVMDRLQSEGIPVAQCPGIPSFIAAAAHAGLSLVSQRQRLVVIPGDADAEGLWQLLQTNHVVVVMKLSQCRQALRDLLLQQPAVVCHYFENLGTPDVYYTTDSAEILAREIPYFSLCILYPA